MLTKQKLKKKYTLSSKIIFIIIKTRGGRRSRTAVTEFYTYKIHIWTIYIHNNKKPEDDDDMMRRKQNQYF